MKNKLMNLLEGIKMIVRIFSGLGSVLALITSSLNKNQKGYHFKLYRS